MRKDARFVFIDSCAVNGFARLNLDPVRALDGSRFKLAMTPGLEAEYRQALKHPGVEPHIKRLLGHLLEHAVLHHASLDTKDVMETDAALVALSRRHFVITQDAKPPWDRAKRHVGLIPWASVETDIRSGASLDALLRARAPYLDD